MSCPICARETDPKYRPFCSRRCADVDLGDVWRVMDERGDRVTDGRRVGRPRGQRRGEDAVHVEREPISVGHLVAAAQRLDELLQRRGRERTAAQ